MREAGLGSGAGLGSEVTRRALLGVAVYPLSLPCRRCPPTVAVPAYYGGGGLFQMRPRAALPSCDPLVRRCESMGIGFAKAAVWSCRVVRALKSPGAASRVSLPVPLRRLLVKSQCGEGVRASGIHPQGSRQRRCVARGTTTRRGVQRPGVPRVRIVVAVLALSPLLPRARTGVSPALPWNALGCVGAGAPALSTAGHYMAGLVVAAVVPRSKPTSAGAQRSTQNWHGPGESDCLIKTKHCDGQR